MKRLPLYYSEEDEQFIAAAKEITGERTANKAVLEVLRRVARLTEENNNLVARNNTLERNLDAVKEAIRNYQRSVSRLRDIVS